MFFQAGLGESVLEIWVKVLNSANTSGTAQPALLRNRRSR